MAAALARPSTMTGIAIWRSCSRKLAQSVTSSVVSYLVGNQPSQTAKMMMKSVPVKKVGTEKPIMATSVPNWSKSEYCR